MINASKQALRIKLCGMTRVQDAVLASELGADAIGLIFYEKSARNVSIKKAQEILASISPLCSSVAVVVNPEQHMLDEIRTVLPIQLIQFHGDETPEFCEQFNHPYIKAVRMKPDTSIQELRSRYASARALLLDTFDKKLVGGTGRPFDWSLLENLDTENTPGPQIILAGGLSPENAKQAIRQTGVRHLDINSGIETAPGIKDHDKLRAMMKIKTDCVL